MGLKKLTNITPAELKAKGVAALADKPNLSASYGVGGLSPTNLKLWFDQIGKFIAEKVNIIQDVLSSDDAASYVKLDLEGLDATKEAIEGFAYSLQDLADSFLDGKFAAFLKAKKNATAEELTALQTLLNNIDKSLSDLRALSDQNLLDHASIRGKIETDISSHNTNTQAHQDIRGKIAIDIAAHNGDMTSHSSAMALKFNRADVMPIFSGEDLQNEGKVPSAKALSGVIASINSTLNGINGKAENSLINVEYNAVTGVIVFTKNNGDTITYDLPSEKILKADASYYDSTTRTLHLVLMDDTDIVINVAHLVDEYYGDNSTITLYTDTDGKKKFKIKDSLKQTLDGYGTTLQQHTEDIQGLNDNKVNYTDIVDNVTTEATDKPVSAKQAKILKSEITSLDNTLKGAYKAVSYDNTTGSFVLTKVDGTTDTVSFPLESFVSDATFDPETNKVTLTVSNGKSVSFDLSALIDYYYGDGTTIEVYDDPNDGFKHKIRVKSNFLDTVNTAISGLDARLSKAEQDIKYLERIDELGSIGRADTETITMNEENGYLSARKLKLADDTILEFIQLTKTQYDAIENKLNTVLYLIDDSGRLALTIGNKVVYSNGVKDTETNNSITFRFLTQAAYDGLTTRDSSKLYIINNDGALALAFGDLFLNTHTEVISAISGRVTTIENSHKTLTGTSKVAVMNSLVVSGISLVSGSLVAAERCLQC